MLATRYYIRLNVLIGQTQERRWFEVEVLEVGDSVGVAVSRYRLFRSVIDAGVRRA